MLLDHLLADRQADSVPGIFRARVQAPENLENIFRVFGGDADPVIGHGKDPFFSLHFRIHSNHGWLGAAKLDGVSDEVLKYLDQLRTIGHYRRKMSVSRDCAALLHRRFQVFQRSLENLIAIGAPQGPAMPSNPRESQQVLHQLLHPQGAVDRIVNVFVRVGIQFARDTVPPAAGYR